MDDLGRCAGRRRCEGREMAERQHIDSDGPLLQGKGQRDGWPGPHGDPTSRGAPRCAAGLRPAPRLGRNSHSSRDHRVTVAARPSSGSAPASNREHAAPSADPTYSAVRGPGRRRWPFSPTPASGVVRSGQVRPVPFGLVKLPWPTTTVRCSQMPRSAPHGTTHGPRRGPKACPVALQEDRPSLPLSRVSGSRIDGAVGISPAIDAELRGWRSDRVALAGPSECAPGFDGLPNPAVALDAVQFAPPSCSPCCRAVSLRAGH
jgi:hypothetical protein